MKAAMNLCFPEPDYSGYSVQELEDEVQKRSEQHRQLMAELQQQESQGEKDVLHQKIFENKECLDKARDPIPLKKLSKKVGSESKRVLHATVSAEGYCTCRP